MSTPSATSVSSPPIWSAQDLSAFTFVVLGLGRFGGGLGATTFLLRRGARVRLVDQLEEAELSQPLADLRASAQALGANDRLAISLGAGLVVEPKLKDAMADLLADADAVVANPAVPPAHPLLQAAVKQQLPITTEIGLLVTNLPKATITIGITGSAGKSTTAAMVAHILNQQDTNRAAANGAASSPRRVHLGGNIGGSLLGMLDPTDEAAPIAPQDVVVLELSSFMLHHLNAMAWSPNLAVITNLSDNHLDWHGDAADYRRCKQAILDHQRPRTAASDAVADRCVLGPTLNQDGATDFAPKVPLLEAPAALNLDSNIPLAVPGPHNQVNARLAITVCAAEPFGIDPQAAIASLASFSGLPHRLCRVGTLNGAACFDDSKSTTPEAAQLALRSFDPGTCHIILGGYDKGSNLIGLAAFAAAQAGAVYTIGATGKAIALAGRTAQAMLSPAGAVTAAGAEVVECETLENAIEEIRLRCGPEDVVVLSPGCASWDQFKNYEERGQAFQSLLDEA